MVFSSGDAARSTYLLWHRFKYQTNDSIRDAIAVPKRAGTQLVSAYGFMLQIIYLHIWAAAVLTGVYFSVRKRQMILDRISSGTDHTSDQHVLEVAADAWTGRSNPSDALRIMGTHRAWKSKRWWIPLVWLLAALAALVINYAIPIVIIPNLVIGDGAPVNPDAIYVPSIAIPSGEQRGPHLTKIASLENPSALRAAGSISAVDLSKSKFIKVKKPITIETRADGSPVLRIDYSYDIRSRDFGLQHFRDLTFHVKGSCYTEYDWLVDEGEEEGTPVDYYHLWNDADQQQQVSLYDGSVPLVYFFPGENNVTSEGTNTTYAALISSIDRQSVTPGEDPWYLTDTTTDGSYYPVLRGRPALSCWQVDSWTSQGRSVNTNKISTLPGLSKFPEQLNTIFARFLSPPKILTVATRLGTRALQSSTSSLGEIFNAETSSLYNDFSWLVSVAYVASANTLTETTLFSKDFDNVPNLMSGEDLKIVADFVIFGSNVSTLAVLEIIVIPTVALGLWVLVFALMWWEGQRKGRIRMLERFKARLETVIAEEDENRKLEEKRKSEEGRGQEEGRRPEEGRGPEGVRSSGTSDEESIQHTEALKEAEAGVKSKD